MAAVTLIGEVDTAVAARTHMMAVNMGNTTAGTTTKNTATATKNGTNIDIITGIKTGRMIGATTMSKSTTEAQRDMAGANTGLNPDIATMATTDRVDPNLIQGANTELNPDIATMATTGRVNSSLIQGANMGSQVSALDADGIMAGAVLAVGGVESAGCAKKVTSGLKSPVN